MKRWFVFFGLVFLPVFIFNHVAAEEGWPVLNGPYLGQKPPGMKAEIFAPGIISTNEKKEGNITMNKKGDMFIYRIFDDTLKDPLKLLALELKSGQWIKSEDLPFDSEYREWDFSFDRKGNRFLFTSTRPAYLNGTLAKNSNIWFTEYSDSKWTKPRLMKFPVNSVESFSGYPSVTKKGVIYFHSRRGDSLGSTDIYAATLLKDGNYELKNIGAPVNSKYKDLDPAISPDGSCLIFMSYKPSEYFADGDMYISLLTDSNTWSVPQALGGILGAAGHPCISQDGKYLFYTCEKRGTPDIYWIDLKAVTGLKPKQ